MLEIECDCPDVECQKDIIDQLEKQILIRERAEFCKTLKHILKATNGNPKALYFALETVLTELEKYSKKTEVKK